MTEQQGQGPQTKEAQPAPAIEVKVATGGPLVKTEKTQGNRMAMFLDRVAPALEIVAKGHIDKSQLVQLMLNASMKTPELLLCTHRSLASALMSAAMLGLRPNTTQGHCYVLPFKNWGASKEESLRRNRDVSIYEATFVMGFKGLIHLAVERSGRVQSCIPRNIYKGEKYDLVCGTDGDKLTYWPSRGVTQSSEKGAKVADEIELTYMIAHLGNGRHPFLYYMWNSEIKKIRDAAKAQNGPWKTWPDPMALKTVVKAGLKYLSVDEITSKATEIDSRFEAGEQISDLMPQEAFEIVNTMDSDDQFAIESTEQSDDGQSQTDNLKAKLKAAGEAGAEAKA